MVEWKKILLKSKTHRRLDSNQNSNVDVCVSVITASLQQDGGLPTTASSRGESASSSVSALSAPRSPKDSHSGTGDLLPDDVRDYYYSGLDMDSAKRLLHGKPVGTFLLRHSQCPDAKYTLSVRSEKHVFNVRIFRRLQADGGYHLDAPKNLRKYFLTISDLLRHYSSSPRELIALCPGEDGVDERTAFRLAYPLSKSESTLNLASATAGAGNEENGSHSRPVTRQMNGGSLKAMVKWL